MHASPHPSIKHIATQVASHAVWRRIAALFCLLAVSACQSIGSSQPVPVLLIPSNWAQQKIMPANDARLNSALPTHSAFAEWWLRFDDPVLNQFIAHSALSNTNIAQAKTVLLQARALRQISMASLQPNLSASAAAQARHDANGNSHNLSLGLDADWEIDFAGGKRAGVAAANAQLQSADLNLAAVQVAVAAQVALSYLDLRAAQARLQNAKSSLLRQQDLLQINRWRHQAGFMSALNVAQVELALAQNQAQLPLLESAIEQAIHALALLSAQPIADVERELLSNPSRPVVAHVDAYLALPIPSAALQQRADVQALQSQVQLALAELSQAEAARWPSISLAGSAGISGVNLAAAGSAGVLSSLIANLALPIFDAGRRKAQVKWQEAAVQQAYIAYQTGVLRAIKEVEDALLALRTDRTRQAFLRLAQLSANSSASLAQQSFYSGIVDYQVVLEAERNLLSVQESLLMVDAKLNSNYVNLVTALGGGWQANSNTMARQSATPLGQIAQTAQRPAP